MSVMQACIVCFEHPDSDRHPGRAGARFQGEDVCVLPFATFLATSPEEVRGLLINVFLKDRVGSQMLNLLLNILRRAWHIVWINIC